jgi:hypothetical protein
MPKTKSKTPMMARVHPGEMLKEDFLDPLGVSQYRLAQAIGFRPVASTRSCTAPAGSAPTPPYACRGSSE